MILVCNKPPLCYYHYKKGKSAEYILRYKERSYKKLMKQKEAKKFALKKPRTATGEKELFRKIWYAEIEHPDVVDMGYYIRRASCVTNKPIPVEDPQVFFFSHILKKGTYPEGRLDPENIRLMTLEEHEKWEFQQHRLYNDKKWEPIFELKERLLNKYKNNGNKEFLDRS